MDITASQVTPLAPITSSRESETLQILLWLFLAAGVLCFFLADGWIDKLLQTQRSGKVVGTIRNADNEVRLRPRSTLTWVNVHRKTGLNSGDTIFVGSGSSAQLDLGDDLKLTLSENSMAQISFGAQDQIEIKLSQGSAQVEAEHATTKTIKLNEKVFDGATAKKVVIAQVKKKPVVKMTPKPEEKLTEPGREPANEISELELPLLALAPPPPEPVLEPIVPEIPPPPVPVIVAPEPPPAPLAKPEPPKPVNFGKVEVKNYEGIQFSNTPEDDPQAVLRWKKLPKVKSWQITTKNLDTGEIKKTVTQNQEVVVTGESPGDFEYQILGVDDKNEPVTKISEPTKVHVRPPLTLPVVESPTNNAVVATATKNRANFILLKWRPSEASQYEIEIANNADFKHSKRSTVNDPAFVLRLDKPTEKIFWRVRALRDQDISEWVNSSFQIESIDTR